MRELQEHVPEVPELAIPAMCFLFVSFFQGKSDLFLFPQYPTFVWCEFPGLPPSGGFVFSEPASQMTSKAEQTQMRKPGTSSFSQDFVLGRGGLHRCIGLSGSLAILTISITSGGSLADWHLFVQ